MGLAVSSKTESYTGVESPVSKRRHRPFSKRRHPPLQESIPTLRVSDWRLPSLLYDGPPLARQRIFDSFYIEVVATRTSHPRSIGMCRLEPLLHHPSSVRQGGCTGGRWRDDEKTTNRLRSIWSPHPPRMHPLTGLWHAYLYPRSTSIDNLPD
jgi:hypothetical protein